MATDTKIAIFGLSHIDVPVTNLERALSLYSNLLGFIEKRRGEAWVDLDTGSCTLRLIVTRKPENNVSIRVQTSTVEQTTNALLALGAKLIHRDLRSPEQELLACVRDFDGNTIYLWRELTEDEYDFVPEVPKVLTWQPEAEVFMQSVLKSVPSFFRALARRKVAAMAEELAAHSKLVTKEEVVRGFILASPKITRYRNRQPLIDHGIDVERYKADWESD